MPKNNVTRMEQSRRTRNTDLHTPKGSALVRNVLNGMTYRSTDVETAANETKQDWQQIIADQVAALQGDIKALLENINYYDETYGTIPGDAPLMEHLEQAGRTLLDAAQDHDQVWIDDTHQRYLDHVIMGREMADMG